MKFDSKKEIFVEKKKDIFYALIKER